MIMLIGEWKSVLLLELAGFTNLAIKASKFWQSENNILRLHFTKLWEVNVVELLVPRCREDFRQ